VARFDPSKGDLTSCDMELCLMLGYDQLFEAYRRFRAKLRELGEEKGPQLIMMGHASVDDPDGAMIV
jgi:hypothetical protein